MDATGAALRPLPTGYRELYDRVLAAARADDRVRAMWLGGSLGRGVADAGSDLDVVLAIAPDHFDDFAATWRDWLAGVTPTVLARDLPRLPGSWTSLTPDCLRLDVVAERAGSALTSAPRLLVLDKDGRPDSAGAEPAGAEPAGEDHRPGPDPARLRWLVEEFFRQLAIFPAAVVARTDWLLGVSGVHGVHLLLYELFAEANQPLPPMGVKQWSAKLTAGQRDVCARLAGAAADREAVLSAMQAAQAAFRLAARPILARTGVPWPDRLEQAVGRYLHAELHWAD